MDSELLYRKRLEELAVVLMDFTTDVEAVPTPELLVMVREGVQERGKAMQYLYTLTLRERRRLESNAAFTAELLRKMLKVQGDLLPEEVRVKLLKLADHLVVPTPLEADGAGRILAERVRQQVLLGWAAEHDDGHTQGELATAAGCYLLELRARIHRGMVVKSPPPFWPFEREAWNPAEDEVRNLEKAGALIAAEIDRLLRKRARGVEGGALGTTLPTEDGHALAGAGTDGATDGKEGV